MFPVRYLPTLLLLAFPALLLAQQANTAALWHDVPQWDTHAPAAPPRWAGLQQHRALQLDFASLKKHLEQAPTEAEIALGKPGLLLALPQPDGSTARLQVWRVPVMHPDLEQQYPDIRTFAGHGADNPYLIVRLDYTPAGFHAMTMGGPQGTAYIEPFQRGDTGTYACFWRKNFTQNSPRSVVCGVTDEEQEAAQLAFETGVKGRAGSCGQLRTYRLALACTAEYALYHGANANNKQPALAAMVVSMNRINAIYERDLSARMTIIPNDTLIIFTDPDTDPYTNGMVNIMLDQNQTTCDNVIGNANYDVGHVLGTGNGWGAGVAFLASVCNNSLKAKAVSTADIPEGMDFDVSLVSHEFGHQYSATHMQYNACNRWDATSMEPGSGSTIMGYSGICEPNVQQDADGYYHTANLIQMGDFLNGSGNGCSTNSGTGNAAPVVADLVNRNIPKSTPFFLTASATDPNGDALTYCWEQVDPFTGVAEAMPPEDGNLTGPMFRTFSPIASSTRYMPRLADVVSGFDFDWEELPSVARAMNFRVTVRDNRPAGGCTTEKSITVSTAGNAGPFAVTKPNTLIAIAPGALDTVKWAVANSNNAPVSCANVDILISTDGGLNFTMLLANTPNDGQQIVAFPNTPTQQGRVMVRSVGNIFYDVSNVNFVIGNYTSQCNQLFNSTDVPKAIPFRNEVSSILTLSASGLVTDVNVKNLNITHARIGELTAWLISPSGIERQLFDQICGASQNMNINFDDEANSAYASIPCPPTNAGNFKPIESLSPFDAEEINGTWTLRVLDNDGIDAGTLNSWGLEFCYLALPVEWLSFTAVLSGENAALLQWSTATEQDNLGFRMERSVGNALGFAAIGWVPGSGDSRETRNYQFTDPNLLPGLTHYYRLRQEDEDGSLHYSKVESVAPRSAAGLLRLSPNPVGNLLYIGLPGQPEAETMLVSIWDASGRKVLEQRIAADQPVDVSGLPAGAYQVQVLEAEGMWNGRVFRH